MRGTHAWVLVVLVALSTSACDDECDDREAFTSGALLLPPPETLGEVAEEVRSFDGWIFVATIGTVETIPDDYHPVAPGLYEHHPRARAAVTLDDDLGSASAPPTSRICASRGRGSLRDACHELVTDTFVEDVDAYFPYREMPETGSRRVLFVERTAPDDRECRGVVHWQAALENGLVSGEHTRSGDPLALEELRLER